MRNVIRSTLMGASALVAAYSAPATAAGALDFLDPCIQAHDEFRSQRNSILVGLDRAVGDAQHAEPTPEYRAAWLSAKRAQFGRLFDETAADDLRAEGVSDIDAARARWVDRRLSVISAEQLSALVAANFRGELREVRLEQRSRGAGELEEAKRELDRTCRMDAGNQALRGALTVALAPLNAISRNLEIARRESGIGAQGLAATTGISIDAINRNGGVLGGGLSGGEGSFFRRNLGIRF